MYSIRKIIRQIGIVVFDTLQLIGLFSNVKAVLELRSSKRIIKLRVGQ